MLSSLPFVGKDKERKITSKVCFNAMRVCTYHWECHATTMPDLHLHFRAKGSLAWTDNEWLINWEPTWEPKAKLIMSNTVTNKVSMKSVRTFVQRLCYEIYIHTGLRLMLRLI
jgi:hypothetical protein